MLLCWQRIKESAMGTIWFWLVAIMITGYVVLDESNKSEETYPVKTGVVLTTNSLSITEDALTARIFQMDVTGSDRGGSHSSG